MTNRICSSNRNRSWSNFKGSSHSNCSSWRRSCTDSNSCLENYKRSNYYILDNGLFYTVNR